MLSKKIIVMRQFYQQAHDHARSERAYTAICDEIKHLREIGESNDNSLFAYLKNQNGKKLKGKGNEHQFKYRMNKGDRIFYTYGEYIPNVPDEYKDSIFIYAYSKHEEQDKQKIPEYTHEPELVTDEDNLELNIDENVYFEAFDFNYISQHSFFVFDENCMPQTLAESDVYLSAEQSQIINEYAGMPEPTLILGGAGTGKTVMELHLLHDFKSTNPDKKCIYFTQSDALLKKAKERYNYIVSEAGETITDNIEFRNINDFCREIISKKSKISYSLSDYININEFYNYIDNFSGFKSQLNKLQINNYDLWSEIRGTIKGGLDKDWHRFSDFNMYEFDGKFIKKLESKKLITRTGNNQQFYINDLDNFVSLRAEFNGKEKEYFNKIVKTLNEVDSGLSLQAEKDYFEVSGQNSTLQPEQRSLIYQIAQNYQAWVERSKKYDDNDLVLKTLAAGILPEDKYDFIVIDEIQDYTELQIYTICQFAKNKECIIMAGDEHQIINPTIFDEERLRKLFYDPQNYKSLVVKKIKSNFRCPKEIVSIANKATNLCMKTIASKGELESEEARFTSRKPFFINYDANTFNTILESLLMRPNVVLLVSDEAERQSIIKKFGQENYESFNNPIISTVAEIKGMEYKYVVCFNLISSFPERWNEILSGFSKKQTRYRYYFNLFYVGITRSQQFLCVIEKNKGAFFETFESESSCDFEYTNTVDEDILCISQLNTDSEDWFEMAKKEFDSGNYTKAKKLLKNVPESQGKELDSKCDMYILIDQKEYTKAAKIALLWNDEVILNRLRNESSIPESIWLIQKVLNNPDTLSKDMLKNNSLSKIINSIYGDTEENYKEKIRLLFIKEFGEYLFDKGDKVKVLLEEING